MNPGGYTEPVPRCVRCGAELRYDRWLKDPEFCSDRCAQESGR